MTPIAAREAVCALCGPAPSSLEAHGKDFEYGTTSGTEWTLHRCGSCGIIFLSPRPDDSTFNTIYPSDYYAYDFTSAPSFAYRVKGWIDRFAVRGYLRRAPTLSPILDVGCGDGRLLETFRKLGVPATRLFGMELDVKAVAAARAKGFDVRHETLEASEYPDGFFGLVVMQQVIEHVGDPGAVLRKIKRIMQPGGVLILETPNVRSLDQALFRRRYWGGYHIPRHFTLFHPAALRELLRRSGFKPVEMRALASPSFWNHSIHHALSESRAPEWLKRIFPSHRPNPIVLACFTVIDLILAPFGFTSNMRVVARA